MLILCEKPSVAKDFAKALGAAGKKGYYEGAGTVITYCVGHLYEPCPPEAYNPDYQKWTLADLPIIPETFRYQVNAPTAEQAARVTELLKKHARDGVLIATDAGREGELIARVALREAGINPAGFRRFWVSEALTPDVIKAGIETAQPLSDYDTLSAQAFARQHADWIVGINLTRYMSIGNPPPPFSVGRVQTAVLAAVAARNDEVKTFVKTPYKELVASVRSLDGVTVTALLENPATGKSAFFAAGEAYLLEAQAGCKDKDIDSIAVKAEGKREKPPKLLNITALQKEAYKRHGYTPEETLNLAQALYETHKCLSYPRTPSRVMGDHNVDLFRETYELLKAGSPLAAFCDVTLITGENKHLFNSARLEDHHALIPLGKLPEAAGERERAVYDIVLESFFTACMPDFLYTEKSLRFRIGPYSFTSTIREVLQKGWKEATQNGKGDAGGEAEVPGFTEQGCFLTGLTVREKTTEPKKEYSIDTLLAFMEHPRGDPAGGDGIKLAGLGTPATRAEIIKTLFSREYLTEEQKKLYAAKRGRFLLEELAKNEHLKRMTAAAQTTEWEQRLAGDPEAFEREITEYVRACVASPAGRASFHKEALGACPLCGKPVVETRMGYGCSAWKDDPNCPFVIWKTVAGAAVTETDAKLLLIGQKTKPKKCRKKDGTPFEAAFALEGGKVVFRFT
ncbi:MAG: DNA topoisomerase [Treponema sp.]|jgi:DNA topoisomerase-3|nr:DNA topoisomerase [Treponema sp.]